MKEGIVVTDVKYSFTGGRETHGRVLCIRIETEGTDNGGNGIWVVQMYMHNSGAGKREKMMKAYEMWAKSHNEPVIIGSDTNSIDDIQEDVEMHVHPKSFMRQKGNKISLKDTLCMTTGEPTPNAGLEKAELFLTTRKDSMQDFYERNQLYDARGVERGASDSYMPFRMDALAPVYQKEQGQGTSVFRHAAMHYSEDRQVYAVSRRIHCH